MDVVGNSVVTDGSFDGLIAIDFSVFSFLCLFGSGKAAVWWWKQRRCGFRG